MEHILVHIHVQTIVMRGAIDLSSITLLKRSIEYMQGYPRLAHHAAEDVLFAKLSSVDRDSQSNCAKLQAQHHWFSAQEVDMLRLLDQARAGDLAVAAALRRCAIGYCLRHAEHIRVEELQLLPRAQRVLPADSWLDVKASLDRVSDPIFGPVSALKRYESLYDYLIDNESSDARLN